MRGEAVRIFSVIFHFISFQWNFISDCLLPNLSERLQEAMWAMWSTGGSPLSPVGKVVCGKGRKSGNVGWSKDMEARSRNTTQDKEPSARSELAVIQPLWSSVDLLIFRKSVKNSWSKFLNFQRYWISILVESDQPNPIGYKLSIRFFKSKILN